MQVQHEAEREKRGDEEDQPAHLPPVAAHDVKQDGEREEDQRDGEVVLQVVAVIIEREPEPVAVVGVLDGRIRGPTRAHHADRRADLVLDQVRQAHRVLQARDRVVETGARPGTPQFIGGCVLEANVS